MLAVEHLLAAIRVVTDVPVFTLVPRYDPPDVFIRVDAGAPHKLSPVHEESLIAVQVYGPEDTVIHLILMIREHLNQRVYAGNPHILGWEEEAGPHPFPDPDTDNYSRWQLTGLLTSTL